MKLIVLSLILVISMCYCRNTRKNEGKVTIGPIDYGPKKTLMMPLDSSAYITFDSPARMVLHGDTIHIIKVLIKKYVVDEHIINILCDSISQLREELLKTYSLPAKYKS